MWEIEIKIETETEVSGWIHQDIKCPWMNKAMVQNITDDMALASILDEDYNFSDNFSENQTIAILDMHDILHKKDEERREREGKS